MQTIFWGSFGFTPSFLFPFYVMESFGVVVRVLHYRSRFVDSYSPSQLNLACVAVLGLHVLLYSYIMASAFYYRMLTTAVSKLREYISRLTLQKNPTLHLVCVSLPPLVKSIIETASRHDQSPSFKSESNARRIITAANQVVRRDSRRPAVVAGV